MRKQVQRALSSLDVHLEAHKKYLAVIVKNLWKSNSQFDSTEFQTAFLIRHHAFRANCHLVLGEAKVDQDRHAIVVEHKVPHVKTIRRARLLPTMRGQLHCRFAWH